MFRHPLENSIRQANLPALKRLIASDRALLAWQDEAGKTPIFLAASVLSDSVAVQFFQFFVEIGADLKQEDSRGRTVTFEVCARGMANCLSFLLCLNPLALYKKDRYGQTPLFQAARFNRLAFIRRIDTPLDLLNTCDQLVGQTVLFYAAAFGHDDLCMVLLRKGADPFIKDKCGQTVLSYVQATPKLKSEIERRTGQCEENESTAVLQEVPTKRLQAYTLKLLRNNQLKPVEEKEKSELLDRFKQLEAKRQQEAYFQDAEFDSFDTYQQNWRNLAIKIVQSCLEQNAGKWFEHTGEAPRLLSAEELKGVAAGEFVGLRSVMARLEHFVYQNGGEFTADMERIWAGCERRNGKASRITKYAHELREHYYEMLYSLQFVETYL